MVTSPLFHGIARGTYEAGATLSKQQKGTSKCQQSTIPGTNTYPWWPRIPWRLPCSLAYRPYSGLELSATTATFVMARHIWRQSASITQRSHPLTMHPAERPKYTTQKLRTLPPVPSRTTVPVGVLQPYVQHGNPPDIILLKAERPEVLRGANVWHISLQRPHLHLRCLPLAKKRVLQADQRGGRHPCWEPKPPV